MTVELWTSASKKDREEAKQLFDDWGKARARIITELTSKLACYSQLPWRLLSLAHHDKTVASHGATICLQLWERGGVGCLHQQSRRFLDPQYPGTASDPSLRALVVEMSKGHALSEDRFLPLRMWLSRFQTIRVAERTIEGTHAVVTRTLKRAPGAQLGYISTELRFKMFWESLCSRPQDW